MTESEVNTSSSSFCSKCLRYENAICSTGTAPGYLDGDNKRIVALWWAMRHFVYFGVALGVLILVPASALYIGIFFLVVHAYKGLRMAVCTSSEPMESKSSTSKEVKKIRKRLEERTDDCKDDVERGDAFSDSKDDDDVIPSQ